MPYPSEDPPRSCECPDKRLFSGLRRSNLPVPKEGGIHSILTRDPSPAATEPTPHKGVVYFEVVSQGAQRQCPFSISYVKYEPYKPCCFVTGSKGHFGGLCLFRGGKMKKRRVIAYVDGFNFYYRRLRNKPYRWLDLPRLFEQFFPDDELVKVRYFTARVGGKFDPAKPLRQQAYLRALQTLSKMDIVEGQFLTTQAKFRLVDPLFDAAGQPIYSAKVWKQDEKGSDVNLGAHLINDAWEDNYDVAVVVTNDSDLAVPIQLAVKRGKTVILLHPDGNPSRSLEASATSVLHIHDTHLRNAQFPDVIQLDNGKVIKKPDSF